MGLPRDIRNTLEDYSSLALECDGMTRVLSYVLKKEKIRHQIATGTLDGPKGAIWHMWIILPDGNYIDYKARMWQGNRAPNGIFDPKKQKVVTYTIDTLSRDLKTSPMVFGMLSNQW